MDEIEQKNRQDVLQFLLRDLLRLIIGNREENNAFLLYHFNDRQNVAKQEDATAKDNRPRRQQLHRRRKDRQKQRKIACLRLIDVEKEDERLLLADLCEWLNHKAWPCRDTSQSFVDEEIEAIVTPIKAHICRVENVANQVNVCWKKVKENNQSKIRNKMERAYNLSKDFVCQGKKVEPLVRQ